MSTKYIKFGTGCSRLLILSVFIAFTANTASGDTLKIGITNNYAPFHFFDDKGKPAGIHYDIIESIAEKSGHSVQMSVLPRKRLEDLTASGSEDAFLNALEWTDDLKRFIYSDPISEVEDVIFTKKQKPLKFSTPEDLFGKMLITIRGYHYPLLEPYFGPQKISLTEASDELAALRMLDSGRGDGAVVVKAVGLWHINAHQFKHQFVFSETPVTKSLFRVIFNKKWSKFLVHFNQELAAMKASGELEQIYKKYIPDRPYRSR